MPLVQRQADSGKITVSENEPATPLKGDLWYDTDDNELLSYNGSAFVGIGHDASETQTLTNKTVALGSNTISGTTAQFNTANTNGTFAEIAATQTLTNKTIDGDLNTILDINETQQDVSSGAADTVLTSVGVGSPPTYQIIPGLTYAAEQNSTPVTDDAETNIANQRYYAAASFVLPTDFEYFAITAIEWKNGTAVAGNFISGVDIVDAQPPVSAQAENVATIPETAQSGTNAVQKVSVRQSRLIRKGTRLRAWMNHNNGAARFRITNGASINISKAQTYTVNLKVLHIDDTAWGSNSVYPYLKVYFSGVGGGI